MSLQKEPFLISRLSHIFLLSYIPVNAVLPISIISCNIVQELGDVLVIGKQSILTIERSLDNKEIGFSSSYKISQFRDS